MRLSVIVCCYNERASIGQVVELVRAQPCVAEILVVDDGSTDGSRDILREMERDPGPVAAVRFLFQAVNQGKGAAVRAGLEAATGDIVLM